MAISERHNYGESGLVAGRAVWRDYAVEARFRLLAETHPRSVNTPFSCHVGRLIPAEAGIAFREETTRKYYFFYLEGIRRFMAHKPYAHKNLARVLRNQPGGQDILGIRTGETLALFAPSK